MAGSTGKRNLKMHVQNLGYPLPYKAGAQKHFSMILQLNGKFNGLYLQNETRLDNRASALQTARGLLHRLKTT